VCAIAMWLVTSVPLCQASETVIEQHGGANAPLQDITSPEENAKSAALVLPPAMNDRRLQAVIRQHVHPKASFVSVEDLNLASRGKFQAESPDASPGFIGADFNGDSIPDYAALLRFPRRGSSAEWLVVFLGNRDGGFHLRLLEKFDGFRDDLYITMKAPGEIKPFNSARAIKLRMPGIARVAVDRSRKLFYWQNGRFQRVAISEKQPAPSHLPSSP
jgi:hypothetical protein